MWASKIENMYNTTCKIQCQIPGKNIFNICDSLNVLIYFVYQTLTHSFTPYPRRMNTLREKTEQRTLNVILFTFFLYIYFFFYFPTV